MRTSQEYAAIWCVNHTLQLSVKDVLNDEVLHVAIQDILVKCRELAKMVRRSEARKDELKTACDKSGTPFILPVLPNNTRWNSTEANVESIMKLTKALQYLHFNDATEKQVWLLGVPTAREFQAIKAIHQCLQPLKIMTKKWEGDHHSLFLK